MLSCDVIGISPPTCLFALVRMRKRGRKIIWHRLVDKIYRMVLLILAGDVELNPGPDLRDTANGRTIHVL